MLAETPSAGACIACCQIACQLVLVNHAFTRSPFFPEKVFTKQRNPLLSNCVSAVPERPAMDGIKQHTIDFRSAQIPGSCPMKSGQQGRGIWFWRIQKATAASAFEKQRSPAPPGGLSVPTLPLQKDGLPSPAITYGQSACANFQEAAHPI